MPICKTCLETPFYELPSEEEAAYPHHQSVGDLEASARECPLCDLILQSMRELIETIAGEEHDGHGISMQKMAKKLWTDEHPGVVE
jgi:hypothetical protein